MVKTHRKGEKKGETKKTQPTTTLCKIRNAERAEWEEMALHCAIPLPREKEQHHAQPTLIQSRTSRAEVPSTLQWRWSAVLLKFSNYPSSVIFSSMD